MLLLLDQIQVASRCSCVHSQTLQIVVRLLFEAAAAEQTLPKRFRQPSGHIELPVAVVRQLMLVMMLLMVVVVVMVIGFGRSAIERRRSRRTGGIEVGLVMMMVMLEQSATMGQ